MFDNSEMLRYLNLNLIGTVFESNKDYQHITVLNKRYISKLSEFVNLSSFMNLQRYKSLNINITQSVAVYNRNRKLYLELKNHVKHDYNLSLVDIDELWEQIKDIELTINSAIETFHDRLEEDIRIIINKVSTESRRELLMHKDRLRLSDDNLLHDNSALKDHSPNCALCNDNLHVCNNDNGNDNNDGDEGGVQPKPPINNNNNNDGRLCNCKKCLRCGKYNCKCPEGKLL